MNYYLSGPMTGYQNWNADTFNEYERKLYEKGADFVFNPTRGAPDTEKAREHSYYMLIDLHELTQSYNDKPIYDVIAMLPGWSESDGARVERDVAIACGIEVLYL